MNFLDLYENLGSIKSKRKLRNEIVKICRVQQGTFYSWKRRNSFPPLIMEKISEIIKIPESELFPNSIQNCEDWECKNN